MSNSNGNGNGCSSVDCCKIPVCLEFVCVEATDDFKDQMKEIFKEIFSDLCGDTDNGNDD